MNPEVVHTAAPPAWARLLNPAGAAADLWRRRDLVRRFTARYFVARYRGTYLGVLWALLFPLAMLAIYTFVFNTIFVAREGADPAQTRSQFAVMLFCGIVVFGIFAESVTRSAHLVVDNPNYVKRVVFPLHVLPVAVLGSSLLHSLFGFALTLAGTAAFFGRIPATAALLPLVLLPLAGLALGFSWMLAAATVFVRDAANAAAIIVGQVLFFATPIFYRVENLPESLRAAALLNPLAVVVENARRVLILGEAPRAGELLLAAGISLAVLQAGYALFRRAARGFADVL